VSSVRRFLEEGGIKPWCSIRDTVGE
jgi:hypothetical protein